MDVIALAMENGVVAGAHDDIKVSRGAAVRAGVAFARNPNALAVAGARLDAYLELLAALDHAFATADPANGAVFAGAVTARAHDVELHAPAGLGNFPFAAAFRTRLRTLEIAVAVAIRTGVAAGDVEPQHRAADRLPEPNTDLVLQV